jgi:hypothetical protein
MTPLRSAPQLSSVMAQLGCVASRRALLQRNVPAREIDAALRSGLLRRFQRGWYATADADIDQQRAVMLGGVIGCVSALRRHGVWGGLDPGLHVHVPSTASRLPLDNVIPLGRNPATPRSRTEFHGEQGLPRVHWTPAQRMPGAVSGQEDRGWLACPLDALRQAVLCQDEENGLASIDSALRLGYITSFDLDPLFASLPARVHDIRSLVDPRADSGQESIVRFRLRREGFTARPQFPLPGGGHLDLLIDGVVGLEVDSTAWHGEDAQVQWDFDKTLQSQAWGIPCLRIRYRHIFFDWSSTLAVIHRAVADARDLRRLREGFP